MADLADMNIVFCRLPETGDAFQQPDWRMSRDKVDALLTGHWPAQHSSAQKENTPQMQIQRWLQAAHWRGGSLGSECAPVEEHDVQQHTAAPRIGFLSVVLLLC